MAASIARRSKNTRSLFLFQSRCRRNIGAFSTNANDSKDGTLESQQLLNKRDPFPLFSSKDVQSLLTKITGFQITKIAGPHLKPMQKPIYKLLTDSELQKDQQDTSNRLQYRLQMPPYMKAREPVTANLVDDPNLAGFDTSKYVFVDCTFGIKDRHRSVMVRETDGSLRQASWDVKERMNQIFNPREGRSVIKPKMFEEQNLERMIKEKKHEYILNCACAQFEPDDPDFIRVSHRVYNAVNSARDFDCLRFTRFFGPMAFYLSWFKICDSLIIDMMNRDMLDDAVDMVRLYYSIHSGSPLDDLKDSETTLKHFIETDANQKNDLVSSLQALLDRKSLEEKSAEAS